MSRRNFDKDDDEDQRVEEEETNQEIEEKVTKMDDEQNENKKSRIKKKKKTIKPSSSSTTTTIKTTTTRNDVEENVDEESFEDLKKENHQQQRNKTKSAKIAFKNKDANASKLAHIVSPKENHKQGGFYIKSIVYGGLDGILTTFSVINAIKGANVGIVAVIIFGISNLIADALSMGLGDFLSDHAEHQFAESERRREKWELDNYPEAELREMHELYEKKGISPKVAKKLVELLSKDKKIFLDVMMVEELGILPHDPDEAPWKNGLVTFFSFIAFGLIPLSIFIIGIGSAGGFTGNEISQEQSDIIWGVCIGATALTLFGLGVFTARFSDQKWWQSGLTTMCLGAITAFVAYGLGYGLDQAVGASDCIG